MLVLAAPHFGRLWLARTVSGLGDGVATVALVLLVVGEGPRAVSAVLLAGTLPRLLGPLAGALADRADARRVLVLAAVVQGACLLVVVLARPPLAGLCVLVAGSAAAAAVVGPASRRALPDLVPSDMLGAANAWLSGAQSTSVLLGSALGGLLVAATSAGVTLLVPAVTVSVAAAVLATLPRLPPVRAERGGLLSETGAGLAYAWHEPAVRALAGGTAVLVAFLSLDNVALVFLVRDELNGGEAAFGALQAMYGGGLLASSVLLARSSAGSPRAWLLTGGLLGGGGTVVTGLSPILPVAAAGQVTAGAGNALAVIGTDTLLQRTTPTPLLGRAAGLVATCAQLGAALAYAAGGPLLEAVGSRAVFLVAGIGSLAALAVLLPTLRKR